MKRKDFYLGQIVYVRIKRSKYDKSGEYAITFQEYEVVKIGRKYVTVKRLNDDFEMEFDMEDGFERSGYSYNSYYRLYLSEQHYKDEKEKYELAWWFKNEFSNRVQNKKYKLDTLRKAKEILENGIE